MPDNSIDANGNGQADDCSRDADDIDRTTDSSGKRRRRSNTNENDDDESSKAKVDKDTDEQQTQAEVDKDKGDSIQLGQKTPIRTKTYDGGRTSTSQDNTTDDSNRSTNDPWPRDCTGRRRTRLSTEQHVSTALDNLNLN